MIYGCQRFKFTQYAILGSKYETLYKNWSFVKLRKTNMRRIEKKNLPYFDNKIDNSINELLIISYEWQVQILINECNTKWGNRLMI